MTQEEVDADAAFVMACCKKAAITVHIRGTDERPVIEFKEQRSRRVVGMSEVKKRLRKK